MTYETGTPSSLADLATKMDTFLVAEGWTQDQLDTGGGKAAWHLNTVFVQVRWQAGVNTTLGIYQSLAFDGTGDDPGEHTDDSGNGAISGTAATIEGERCVEDLGAAPFTAYHFFADDEHFYCVLETTTAGIFRHFGWGDMEAGGTKYGDGWTGGEFAYGHFHIANALDVGNTVLADGLFDHANDKRAATVHMEGMPNQAASSKWGQIWGATYATARPVDRATNAKNLVVGGFRSGAFARNFGWPPSMTQSGYVSLIPIFLWYVDGTTSPEELRLMGSLPDIAMMNMNNFDVGEEFTIGSDTWKVFPTVAKADTASDEESQNQGIAYKKVP